MQGQTIKSFADTPLVRGIGSEDAELVNENNFHSEYYWMVNKYGRKVPVGLTRESSVLAKGYRHTDHKIYKDDRSQRVVAPPKEDPMVTMAKVAEKLVEKSEKEEKEIVEKKKDK